MLLKWGGGGELKKVEQVHKYACKKVLSVSQKTPNGMIYGEWGRHPLYINTLVKAVKYWLNLVELPYCRLQRQRMKPSKSWMKEALPHE